MNAVKELGKRLAARLDEDDWGYIEPFLNECETELESLRQQLAEVTNEKREYQLEAQGQIEFLDKKLAECQAQEAKLREALKRLDSVAHISCGSVTEALALPNDATALNNLIAERTASLTAEVERLKDCWSAEGAQVDALRQKNAELTAQRDALLAFAASYIAAWNNGSTGDSDIFFMAESAIANCKEPPDKTKPALGGLLLSLRERPGCLRSPVALRLLRHEAPAMTILHRIRFPGTRFSDLDNLMPEQRHQVPLYAVSLGHFLLALHVLDDRLAVLIIGEVSEIAQWWRHPPLTWNLHRRRQLERNLAALVIEVTGRVTHSNLVEFKAAANAVISGIKTELVTDQDFVDASAAVKYLKDVEDNAKRAKQNALDQTTSIAELHRALDEVAKMAGDVRKALDKKITEEKDRRKEDIVRAGADALGEYWRALNDRIDGYMPPFESNFGGAVKGLKSLDSMREKVDAELARCKIATSEIADRIEYNIKTLEGEGFDWRFLFPDLASVCAKAKDDFTALLMSRVAKHKEKEAQRLEAEREKIRAEEQAKAQREAEERAAAEQAERNRVAAEEIRRLDAERKAAADQAAAANQTQFESAATDACTAGVGVVQISANEAGQVEVKHVVSDAIAAPANACLPKIKLGEICTRLGFTVSAEFLASLGFEATTDKNAKLYNEASFPAICRRISDHTLRVGMTTKLAA